MVENASLEKLEDIRIVIPTIGTELTLTQPWALVIFHGGCNYKFVTRLGVKYGEGAVYEQEGSAVHGKPRSLHGTEIVFPVGTKLKVARIYVRQGVSGFDSVTFSLAKKGFPGRKDIFGRFWAKLYDVNRIVCTFNEKTVKVDSKVNLLTQIAAAAVDEEDLKK